MSKKNQQAAKPAKPPKENKTPEAEREAPARETTPVQQGPDLEEGVKADLVDEGPGDKSEDDELDEDFDHEQWELARRLFSPGENPDGSVSGVMENGEQLTLPVKTAIAVVKWMQSLPPTTPDDGQRRIWSCRLDAATEKHLHDTITIWTYPEAFEKTFAL